MFPFFFDFILYLYEKYINTNYNNEYMSINCLLSFLYFLICYALIHTFFSGGTSYSLINAHCLICKENSNLENTDNVVFVSKIGASIGSFLKDTVENSISIIIFYLLIIIINEIHIII